MTFLELATTTEIPIFSKMSRPPGSFLGSLTAYAFKDLVGSHQGVPLNVVLDYKVEGAFRYARVVRVSFKDGRSEFLVLDGERGPHMKGKTRTYQALEAGEGETLLSIVQEDLVLYSI